MENLTKTKALYLSLVIALLMLSGFMSAQQTSLPYFNGFESQLDTVSWMFIKSYGKPGFAVGNAVHCLGYQSMYISSDTGRTATSNGGSYISIAYKSFTLPAGTYNLAFDYQMGGAVANHDMKVAFVPSSTIITASDSGASYPSFIINNQFTDNSGDSTFGVSAWRHITGTLTANTAGTYNLCFAFRCNSNTVIAPGACVDNIQIDTIHANTDCVATPTNITVVKDVQAGVIVCWNGNASSYEVVAASASNPTDYSFVSHDRVSTMCDTFQYSELGEGQYFFYVRPICGNDTGMYAETSGHLIYDVSKHCIDFITFNAPGTLCTYGTYSSPYQTTGCIDNGPSQMSSRHTVHTDINETDPRTNGSLHTVPPGEMMSVRLGNWGANAEAESVCYSFDVPVGSNLIIMLRYAVVFEESDHSEPPEFKLEIMNANYQLLNPVCNSVNFLCDGTLTQGWHSCQAPGSYGVLSTVWYKDWTTLGINLSSYAGQTIKIRFTTYDCGWSGHFGYAYFTLNCIQAELTGEMCADGSTKVTAPDGFDYQWINDCTSHIVSAGQIIFVADSDSCNYTCLCRYKNEPGCYFALNYNNTNFCEITAKSNDITKGTVTGGGSYVYGDTVILTATANAHCHFVRWTDGDTASQRSVIATSDTAYTAIFELDIHIVSCTCVNGSVLDLGAYRYGSIASIHAVPNEHYHFVNWSNGETSTTLRFVVTSDTTFIAYFDIDKHIINALSNNDNYGTVTGGGVFDYGSTVILSATSNKGCHFVSWSNGSTTPSISMVVAGDTTLVASFAQDIYDVLVMSNYADRGVVTGGGQFYYNDIATLTATPNSGYVFIGWDNGETNKVLRVAVVSDTVITAIFNPEGTGVDDVDDVEYAVFSEGGRIVVSGASEVFICDAVGRIVYDGKMESDVYVFAVPVSGVYFVRCDGKKSYKVVVR